MSDISTLIADARTLAQKWRDSGLRYGNEKILDDLADALEVVAEKARAQEEP